MIGQERTFVDIEKEIAKRVESDLKESHLPGPTDDRWITTTPFTMQTQPMRKGVGGGGLGGIEGGEDESGQRSSMMCPKQHSQPNQMNSMMKTPRQPSTIDNGSLNFSTSSEDFDVTFSKKPKTIRDPMSHRIIEKRRRDRMNNCLADLSRLIPTDYLKQGQGRIEKTEIIEMAIKHIKNLTNSVTQPTVLKSSLPDRYLGFKECQDEVMRYLVEIEGWDAMDKLCTCLMAHLEQAGEKFRIMNDESLSRVAKEEQYRHADEEMGTCHKHKKARVFDPQAPATGFPPVQMPLYPAPVDQAMINAATPVQQQQNTPMETQTVLDPQTVFQNFSNFESAQQITREHLKRDKHLWTLLQSQYNSTSMNDSGVSTDPGSSSSNTTEPDKLSEQTATSNSKSFCETGSGNSSLDSSSEQNGSSVYKFKHNITKRFSLEKNKPNPSDTSSSSSNEENRAEKGKRKFRHVRSRSPSSSHYINTETRTATAPSTEEAGAEVNTDDTKPSDYLPAFVLHPVGTHYIPLSIHPSSIGSNVFRKSEQNVYHPISIPVNFCGPLLYLDRVCINSDSCASFGSSSTNSPIACSAENSSTCNSENSPSPAQQDALNTQS